MNNALAASWCGGSEPPAKRMLLLHLVVCADQAHGFRWHCSLSTRESLGEAHSAVGVGTSDRKSPGGVFTPAFSGFGKPLAGFSEMVAEWLLGEQCSVERWCRE